VKVAAGDRNPGTTRRTRRGSTGGATEGSPGCRERSGQTPGWSADSSRRTSAIPPGRRRRPSHDRELGTVAARRGSNPGVGVSAASRAPDCVCGRAEAEGVIRQKLAALAALPRSWAVATPYDADSVPSRFHSSTSARRPTSGARPAITSPTS